MQGDVHQYTIAALIVWSTANETKEHNPIMRHSRADCVTNGVGHVMEFLSMDADRSVSSI